MESLHFGKILGENCINSGLYWETETGTCCANSGRVCGCLAAGRGLLQRHKLYAYPAGGYFSVMKSRQKNFI